MRFALVFLCFSLAACSCDPAAGTRNYRCAAPQDCADGFACVSSKCTAVALLDGGAGGAGGNCVSTGATETNCGDGKDDDCDGLMDCEDPDCSHKPCSSATGTWVCCGQGANATECKNLSADGNNCGGCGTTCGGGSTCRAENVGTTISGACSCSGAGCPTGQTCAGTSCSCGSSSGNCAAGQSCLAGTAGDPSICHY